MLALLYRLPCGAQLAPPGPCFESNYPFLRLISLIDVLPDSLVCGEPFGCMHAAPATVRRQCSGTYSLCAADRVDLCTLKYGACDFHMLPGAHTDVQACALAY